MQTLHKSTLCFISRFERSNYEVSCEKETLLNLLNIASRAVTGKSSMPLLEGLLLAADADTLTITGYDLSMGIRTTAQVDVVEPGRIVLIPACSVTSFASCRRTWSTLRPTTN